MAITTISNLPNLQTGFNRISRTAITIDNDNKPKFLGFDDLFEITLRSENSETAPYSNYSSKITVAELHTQLLGKLRYVNYNATNTFTSQTVPPLMFNPTTKYYKGDRIFYIKDNSSLVRIIRYIGKNGLSGSTIAPSINTVADYQTTSATIESDIKDYISITNNKNFCWICENEILSNNVFPLFSPMLSMTKLLSTSWLEATTDFTSYYASTYCGIGNILSDLMLNENTEKTVCTIDGTSALLFSNITDDTVGVIDDKYNNGYISVNYTNLKALVVNAAQNSTIVEKLKNIYSPNNQINTSNTSNTIVKNAESLNFWLIIIDYSDSATVKEYTPISRTDDGKLQLTDYAKSKIDSSNLKFAFIPPRVYNNEVLELDEKKYLYFYAGNAFSEKTTKDINLSYFLSAFLKRDCTNTITGQYFLFDKPAYSSGAVSNAAEGRVFGLSDNYSYLRIQGGGDDGTRPNGAQLRLGGYNYKGSAALQGGFSLKTALTNGDHGPALHGYNGGELKWSGNTFNLNGRTLTNDSTTNSLKLSGNALTINNNLMLFRSSSEIALNCQMDNGNGALFLRSAASDLNGAVLRLYGADRNNGAFAMWTAIKNTNNTYSNNYSLTGYNSGKLHWTGNNIQFGPENGNNWSSIFHSNDKSVVNICSSNSNRTGGNLRLYSNKATGYSSALSGAFELYVTDDTCVGNKQHKYKLSGYNTGTMEWTGNTFNLGGRTLKNNYGTLEWSGHSIKITSDEYNWNGITLNDDKSNLTICGCTNYTSGGTLILLGKDNDASGESLKGAFYLTAQTSTKKYLLTGYTDTDGTLKWSGNTFNLGGRTLKNNPSNGTLSWSGNHIQFGPESGNSWSSIYHNSDTSVVNVCSASNNTKGGNLRLYSNNTTKISEDLRGGFELYVTDNNCNNTKQHKYRLIGYNYGALVWSGPTIRVDAGPNKTPAPSGTNNWTSLATTDISSSLVLCGGTRNDDGGSLALFGSSYNDTIIERNRDRYLDGGFSLKTQAKDKNGNAVTRYSFTGYNNGVLLWSGNTFRLGGKDLTVVNQANQVNQATLMFNGERVGHHIGEIFYTYRQDVLGENKKINGAYACDGRSVEITEDDEIFNMLTANTNPPIPCSKPNHPDPLNNEQYTTFIKQTNNSTAIEFHHIRLDKGTTNEDKYFIKTPNLIDKFIQGTAGNVGNYVAPGLPNITGSLSHWGNGQFSNVKPEGALYAEKGSGFGESEDESGSQIIYKFDASRSNRIYGSSTTVQPPAVRLVPLIQIF